MWFFCTGGKGTEKFIANEIREKLSVHILYVRTGKVFFDYCGEDLSCFGDLKTVERIFISVYHQPGYKLTNRFKAQFQLRNLVDRIRNWQTYQEVWRRAQTSLPRAVDPSIPDTPTTETSVPTEGLPAISQTQKSLPMEERPSVPMSAATTIPQTQTTLSTLPLEVGPSISETQTNNTSEKVSEGSQVSDVQEPPMKRHKSDDLSQNPSQDPAQYPSHDPSPDLSPDPSVPQGALDRPESAVTCRFRMSVKCSGQAAGKCTHQDISKMFGIHLAKKFNWRIDLNNPEFEVYLQLNDEGIVIGIPIYKVPLSERSYIKKPGLRCTVAYIMAKLAKVQTGDLVLDPMCGAGTILLEAAKLNQGALYIGADLKPGQLEEASANVEYGSFSHQITLLNSDVRALPLPDSSVDHIVCDLPFGLNEGTVEQARALYPKIVRAFLRVLKPCGRCVLLTSAQLRPDLLRAAGIWKDHRAQPQREGSSTVHTNNVKEEVVDKAKCAKKGESTNSEDGPKLESSHSGNGHLLEQQEASDTGIGHLQELDKVRASQKDTTPAKCIIQDTCSSMDRGQRNQEGGQGDTSFCDNKDIATTQCETQCKSQCESQSHSQSESQTEPSENTQRWALEETHYMKLAATNAYICVLVKQPGLGVPT